MKTVGIIGGLGPETTAHFILRVLSLCFEKNKIQRPNIISINVPITFKLEEEFINKSKGKKEFRKLLVQTAKTLEDAKVDFIVMPCNTAHVFIDDIRKSVNIPVLSIIDESANSLKNIESVGLLSTPATVKNKLFNSKLNLQKPIKSDQKELGIIINRILNNQQTENDRLKVLRIIESFTSKNILLACTDLQLVIQDKQIGDKKIFDTMEILAQATAKEVMRGGEKC